MEGSRGKERDWGGGGMLGLAFLTMRSAPSDLQYLTMLHYILLPPFPPLSLHDSAVPYCAVPYIV
jgi:hypothetical protein